MKPAITLQVLPMPLIPDTVERPDPNTPEAIIARVRGLAMEWDRNTGQLATVYHQFARELIHTLAYRRKP